MMESNNWTGRPPRYRPKQQIAFVGVLLALLIFSGLSASAATSNVKALTIAKVHLGMTPAETMKAVASEAVGHVQVSHTSCFGENAVFGSGHCVAEIAVLLSGDRQMQLLFTEDFPAHRHVSRLTTISFSQSSAGPTSKKTFEIYLKGAEAKFGRPTESGDKVANTYVADNTQITTFARWCTADPCDPLKVPQVATLSFTLLDPTTATFDITDNAFIASRQAAVQKAQESGVKANF